MPYIRQEEREKFNLSLIDLASKINTKGELNYCFFKLCQLIINRIGESYDNLSRMNGAMSDCALEWYRQRVVPYEKQKKIENGDIF